MANGLARCFVWNTYILHVNLSYSAAGVGNSSHVQLNLACPNDGYDARWEAKSIRQRLRARCLVRQKHVLCLSDDTHLLSMLFSAPQEAALCHFMSGFHTQSALSSRPQSRTAKTCGCKAGTPRLQVHLGGYAKTYVWSISSTVVIPGISSAR